MKKILVLTDFSDCAGMAVRAAMEIAKKNEAHIHFLNCKSVPYNWVHLPNVPDKFYQDISKEIKLINTKLENLVKMAEDKDIEASHSICYNEDNYAVVEYINDHEMDFVMMGSHGARGLKEAFLGSNAQKIVRYSSVPVFVVKKEFSYMTQPRIVFVSDFEGEMLEPFHKALEFSKMIGAIIDLIFINTPSIFTESWEVKSRMDKFKTISDVFLGNCEIIDANNFEKGIDSYCYNQENCIIAMATHGRSGIVRLLTGSKTEDVINHIENTILSLHV